MISFVPDPGSCNFTAVWIETSSPPDGSVPVWVVTIKSRVSSWVEDHADVFKKVYFVPWIFIPLKSDNETGCIWDPSPYTPTENVKSTN